MFIWLPVIAAIFRFLFQLWKKLPPEVKEQVIDSIVAAFVDMFRAYYQKWKESQ